MHLIHSLNEIRNLGDQLPSIGLTIGNFDGVHKGHQLMLQKIKEACEAKKLKLAVITFTPHPQKILHPEKVKFLISSYEQRRKIISQIGVDFLIEVPFTRDFSTLTPEEFLERFIFVYPNIDTFFLGYDFAFGANKKGDHSLVKSICDKKSVFVEVQSKYELDNMTISSSLIRSHISKGDFKLVNEILGRPFHLEGVVIKGEGRGKKIGFPTANIQPMDDLILPEKGVYVTKTHYKDMTFKSITNIGVNPTFKDDNIVNIETNIFDFNLDIYGEKIDVEFLHKVRNEKKFSTVNDLISQISTDVEFAKKYLT